MRAFDLDLLYAGLRIQSTSDEKFVGSVLATHTACSKVPGRFSAGNLAQQLSLQLDQAFYFYRLSSISA